MDMLGGMGGGGSKIELEGPRHIVSPIQYPGILNPTIYIKNTLAPPIYPIIKAPNVNLKLNIDGLKEYYSQEPIIMHRKVQKDYVKKLRSIVDQ